MAIDPLAAIIDVASPLAISQERAAVELALILVLAVSAQLLAPLFRVPSILLLLLFGFMNGDLDF